MSKDKHGMEYAACVAIQQKQLTMWSERLKLPIYNAVAEYVLKHNEVANDENQPHRVLRGQDIVQVIMDWPELKPCYPSIKEEPVVEDLKSFV